MQVAGGLLGTALKASGEFVGTPSVQWMRQVSGAIGGDSTESVPIPYATGLEYMPNADDVGACLRIECVGPYGGLPVVVDTSPIALDPSTYDLLQGHLRRGHAEFSASTLQQVRPVPSGSIRRPWRTRLAHASRVRGDQSGAREHPCVSAARRNRAFYW